MPPFEDSFGLPTRDFLEADPERLMNRARVVAGPRPMDVVWPGRGGARTPFPADAGADDWVTPSVPGPVPSGTTPPAAPPQTPPSTPQAPPQIPATPPQQADGTDDWITPEEVKAPEGVDDWTTPPEDAQAPTPDAPKPPVDAPQATSNALPQFDRFTPPGGLGPDVATYGKVPGPEPEPVPAVAGLDLPPGHKFNTGGTALDKVLGPDTGMLTGPEAYESKYGKPARDEVKSVPGLKDVPAQEAVPGSIAEAEDRLAIARDNLDAARGDAATRAESPVANANFRKEARGRVTTAERHVEAATAAVEAARKRPLDTQTGARSNAETGVQNVGQFAVDTMAHVRGLLEVAAEREAASAKAGGALLGNPELADAYKKLAADLQKTEDETQALVDRSARPDRAKAEDFETKLTAGAVSMGIFMAGGVAARALGISSAMGSGGMGALQMGGAALREVEDEAKKVSANIDGLKARGLDTTKEEARLKELLGAKYVALFANSALGATEAIPIERFLERLNAVPGASGKVAHILANTAKQSIEEVLQEVGQQIGQNIVANYLWDHSREIFGKDVTESGEIAAILGAVMGGGAGVHGAMRGDHLHGHGLPTPPPAAPLDTDLTPSSPVPTSSEVPPSKPAPTPPAPNPGAGPSPPTQSEPPKTAEEAAARLPPGPGTTTITINGRTVTVPPAESGAPPGAPTSDAADITDIEHAVTAPPALADTYERARDLVRTDGKASTSYIQRKLGLGYGDAARIVDRLEAEGIVGPADHAGKREILPVAGTRQAPIEIKSDADIERIGDVVRQDHTAAQGEAHNVQHEHADWHGFGVTIEAPAGGIRRGTAPDGTPFEQTFTHPYGYLKGTKGADGMEVDAYLLGAEPQAFVLDELDEKTGKFRQHKVFLGAADSEAARAAYLGTQGKKPEQWGGGRMMSADELKDWSKSGDMTKPLLKEQNRRGGEERNKVLRAYGYPQIQIDRMGEKERVKEFYDAVQAGVKAEDFKPDKTDKPDNIQNIPGEKPLTSLTSLTGNRELAAVPDDVFGPISSAEIDTPYTDDGSKRLALRPDEVRTLRSAGINVADNGLVDPDGIRLLADERTRRQTAMREPAAEHVAAIDAAIRETGENPDELEPKDLPKLAAEAFAWADGDLDYKEATQVAVGGAALRDGEITEKTVKNLYGQKVLDAIHAFEQQRRVVRSEEGRAATNGADAKVPASAAHGSKNENTQTHGPVGKTNGAVGQAAAASGATNGRGGINAGSENARPEQAAKAGRPEGFFDRQQEDVAPKTESTEAQYVIPGAERISMREHLERKAREPKRAPKRGSRVKSRVKEIEGRGEPPPEGGTPPAPKTPRAPPPMSAMTYLASRGGLSSHVPGKAGGKPVLNAELKKIGLSYRTRVVAPGMGWRNVLRKDGGMTMDEAREALIEGKYLPNDKDNTPSDADAHRKIYEMLSEEHNHKRPTYAQGEENADVEDHARRAAQDGEDEIDVYEQDVRDAVKETDTFRYITSPDHYFRRAATIMATEGLSAEDAWLAAVEREHLEDGLVTADELLDIYDLGDLDGLYPKTPTAPANVATDVAEGGRGDQSGPESEAEGRGGRGEGVGEDRETPASQQERIAELAVRDRKTGKVWSSKAVHTDIAEDAAKELGITFQEFLDRSDDGYVTNKGRFVGREEAAKIAMDADQTNGPVHEDDTGQFLAHDDLKDGVLHGNAYDPTEAPKDEITKTKVPVPSTEKTAAGEQTVLPGTEKISKAEEAQRKTDKPLKPKAAQRPMDEGLFGDGHKQLDLVEMAAKEPAATKPEKAPEPSTEKPASEPAPEPVHSAAPGITEAEATRKLEEARQTYHRLKHTLDGMEKRLENPVKAKNSLDQLRLEENRKITERNARNLRKKVAEALDAVDDARKVRDAATPAKHVAAEEAAKPMQTAAAAGDEEIPDFLLRNPKKETVNAEPTVSQDQAVAPEHTLHGRPVRSDIESILDDVEAGRIKQREDKEGQCYPTAGQDAIDGAFIYVVGLVNVTTGTPVYHGIVKTSKDGIDYYSDPTLNTNAWFPEDVFRKMVSGFVPVHQMFAGEVKGFGQRNGKWPDPVTLKLPTIAQVMKNVREGTEIPRSKHPNAGIWAGTKPKKSKGPAESAPAREEPAKSAEPTQTTSKSSAEQVETKPQTDEAEAADIWNDLLGEKPAEKETTAPKIEDYVRKAAAILAADPVRAKGFGDVEQSVNRLIWAQIERKVWPKAAEDAIYGAGREAFLRAVADRASLADVEERMMAAAARVALEAAKKSAPTPQVPSGETKYVLPSFATAQYAKPRAPKAAPKTKAEPSNWTEIGKNADGRTLFEDQRGVRSYVENGVRITEPVQMRPTRAGMEMAVDRTGKHEWEVAKPDQQTELTDRATEQKAYPPLQSDTTGRVPQEAVNERVTQMIEDGFSPVEAQTKISEMIRNAENPTERTAGEAAKSAVKNVSRGTSAAVEGLFQLFNTKNTLSAGLTFDEETWAKAKPFFIQATKDFSGAWKDMRDFARKLLEALQTRGLHIDDIRTMRPYLERFTVQVKRGEIDLNPKTSNEVIAPSKSDAYRKYKSVQMAQAGEFPEWTKKGTDTTRFADIARAASDQEVAAGARELTDLLWDGLGALSKPGTSLEDSLPVIALVQSERDAYVQEQDRRAEQSNERGGPEEGNQGEPNQVPAEGGRGNGSEGDSGRGHAGEGDRGAGGNGSSAEAGVQGARGPGSDSSGVSKTRGTGRGSRVGAGRIGANGKRVPRKSTSADQRGREPGSGPVAPEQVPSLPAINFKINDEVHLGEGGEKVKFNANVFAIQVLKDIERENRRATPDEQNVLSRYVGWGGLANAFRQPETNEFKPEWKERGEELESALTKEELRAARSSTQYAHYTSRTVIDAMWNAVRHMGFNGGLAVETSAGVGNFLGLIPDDIAGSTKFIAVEKDGISARIAKLLYPQETVLHAPFEAVPLPDGEATLVIGNPPFSQHSLMFQNKPELTGMSMHNQFLLAGLDALRPGGVQAVVVSRYVMDAADSKAREMMAVKANLIGAIRLPDTAFKENARTDVVTDVLFFQRRTKADEAETKTTLEAAAKVKAKYHTTTHIPHDEANKLQAARKLASWIDTTEIKDPLGGAPMRVNQYFASNPRAVMGQLERSGKMQMSTEEGMGINVKLEGPLAPRLAEAIAKLPDVGAGLQHDVLAASLARHEAMSESLSIALAGSEVGHVERNVDGKLTQVSERETPSGDYELTRRVLSSASPWSRELSLDKDGRWYVMEAAKAVDLLQQEIDRANALIVQSDAKQNVSEAHHLRVALSQLKERLNKTVPTDLAKDGKRNIYTRKFYPNNEVPASMRLGDSKYERLVEAVNLRDLTKRQLTIEAEDAPAAQMDGNRRKLAAAYNAFIGRHGLINDPRNIQLLNDMPDGAIVLALEFGYRPAVTNAKAARSGEKARPASATPAPILSRRVVPKYEPATSADSAADAVSIVLSESGRLDMERIASLIGTDEAGAIAKLTEGEKPLAYLDPETKTYEPRNAYLSGQVAKKLAAARVAGLTKNAEDLKAVLPERWTAENVTAIIGNNWIPPEVYANFANHLLGTTATAHYSKATNAFALYVGNYERERQDQWGTPDMPADAILRGMLNSKVPKVLDPPDDKGTRRVNQELSTLVMMKAREIENEFADWVFKDGDRRNQLVDIYNDKFNTRVTRQHDGSHMTLPGKVPDEVIKLRRHQKNAVWRGVYERFMLLDHVVGAGKTIVAIARAMERRRMGLSRKPMITVPNHLVDQWVQDIYKLYPGAKVLAAGRNQFDRKNRRRLFARIATGDWDIVVVPHSSFGFIGVDPATELRFLDQDLKLAVDAVREAKEQAASEGTGGRSKPFTVKEAEKLVETITARMAKLKLGNKERMLTFEQMGIDDLTTDESHEFKNLWYSSRLTGVRGMGDKAGSKKAFDLYNKIRTLRESPTGTVTFMTGTPISNSAVEMFTILRYLAAQDLKDLGLEHFDAWRSQYVSAQPAFEPTEAGGLKEVTRLGRSWSNMRSLMELYYSFTDAVSQDDINRWHAEDNNGARFPVPKVKGGGRQEVVVKPTPAQLDELGGIVAGFNMLPEISNPIDRNKARLRLMDRARKVSLDVRAANKMSDSKEEGGKLDQIADQVARIHKAWTADKGTQLIFLDRGVKAAKSDAKTVKEYDEIVAKRDAALAANDEDLYRKLTDKLDEYDPNEMKELRIALQGGWNAYDQLKENLIKRGVPANEIRFVQEANSDAEKRALFDLVREGAVRVLIGSTPKMGAGTNVQRRLVALHHADVTWKPSDIEQREGRIIRQGDGSDGSLMSKYGDKFEVEILAYATERTVDAKMWDLNSQKLRTINGIRKYNGEFNMEFEDEDAVGMAEIAALASGDPLLLERVKLISQLDKFEMLDRAYRRRMFGIDDRIQAMERAQRDYPAMIKAGQQKAEIIKQGMREIQASAENRSVTVEGKKYDSMMEAVKAATNAIELAKGGDENARYTIMVDGQRLTNKSGIQEAIENAIGDVSAFEVTAKGETWRRRSQLAKELSNLATNAIAGFKGDDAQTVDGTIGKMGGLDLKWGASRTRWADVVSLWLEHNGIVLADAENSLERGKTKNDVSTQLARSTIDKLFERAKGDAGFTGDYLQGMIDEANAKLPATKKERAEAKFPQAEEMAATRKRLEEVIRTLDERTKAEEGRGKQEAPPSTLNQPGSMFSLNREYNVVRDADGKIVAKPAYMFEPRGSLPLGMQAQMHVMRRGIVTGLEHLTAIDANGNIVDSLLGNERSINISGKLLAALNDPSQSIVVHHNHPNDHGFSNADLATLGHPGMAALWAHGHRGTIVRAALTPQARATFGRMLSMEARSRLFTAAERIDAALTPILSEAVAQRIVSEADANRIEAHATALILHRAGVIDYDFSLPRVEALMAKVPGLDRHINMAAGTAAMELLHVIPTDRRATQVRGTLSHPGEVGTAFENARSRTTGPVGATPNQSGPAGDSTDQATTSPPLRFEARPPKRFRRAGTGTPPLPMPHFTPLHTGVRAALRDRTMPLTERYSAALGAMFLPAARKFWDKLIDLARMQRAAEMFNGVRTPQRLDTHLAAILYPGITGERLKDASWDLFRPIYDAMKAHNVSPSEIQDYLYARHAEERNMVVGAINQPGDQFRLAMTDHSLVGASGMSTDEANSILAHVAMRQSDFDAVAALVDAVNAHNQNLMETEGLEHLSTIMTWNRAYQHYVPLRGEEVGSEDEHGSPPLGKGFSTRGPESMRALGRGTRAGSILAHLLDQTNRLIIRAEKTKVGKTFARWAIANPNPDLYKIGLGTVRRGVNPATGLVEIEWVPTPAQHERAFAFKIAGDTHYIEFAEGQEGMLLALKNLGVPRFGALMRTAQWMTRTWSSFQTAKDPQFVTSNFLRDIQEAGLAITAEQRAGFQAAYWKNLTRGRSFLAAVMGQVGVTGNRYSQLYDDWRHDGGKISSFGWKDVDTIVKDIQREMTRRTESMTWKVAAQPWRIIDPVNGHIVHLFEALNDIMESTTRLAVYAAGRDIGLTRAVSAAAARAMTVDFSRGGEAKGTIQALYAFANPAIQGQVNLVRRLKSRRFRYIYGSAIPSAAFMLTLYNLWASPADDDDEKKRTFYEEMKQWDRDQNIVFFLPGSKDAKKLPLNFMARPAWALGENAAMAMMGKIKPGEALLNFMGSTAQAFNPLGSQGSAFDLRTWAKTISPTFLDPIIELGFNRDWLNRPIHPDEANWNRGIPHSQQSKMTTSTHAEDVAQGLNRMTGGSTFSRGVADLYPDDVEYAWNFLLGGYGKFVLRTGDLIRDKIDGIDTPVEKIPFVNRFVTEGGSENQKREAYYEKHHEADERSQQVRNAIRAERAGKNVEDAQKTIDELADKVGARVTGVRNGVPTVSTRAETAFRDADHKLSQLRTEERELRRDKNLSRAERIQRVKTNRKEQQDIMRTARDRYESVAQP